MRSRAERILEQRVGCHAFPRLLHSQTRCTNTRAAFQAHQERRQIELSRLERMLCTSGRHIRIMPSTGIFASVLIRLDSTSSPQGGLSVMACCFRISTSFLWVGSTRIPQSPCCSCENLVVDRRHTVLPHAPRPTCENRYSSTESLHV